jgi:hypothetical protein
VPDLHGWITQQIDTVEAAARAATDGPWHVTEYDYPTDFAAGIGTALGEVDVVGHGYEGGGVEHLADARHIAFHDPAAVLRRCAADRKIIARHQLDPDVYWAPACAGCGTYGDQDMPYTDNLNECPELLDLAEGYGITTEILAGLDQPTPPERPAPRPGGIYSALHAAIPAHSPRRGDVPPTLRGPNWKTSP